MNAYEEAEQIRQRSEQWFRDYITTGIIQIHDMPPEPPHRPESKGKASQADND